MRKDLGYIQEIEAENGDEFNLKDYIFRFLNYWPWFLLTLFLSAIVGFLYMRYAPTYYVSEAKIKIIDDSKEIDLSTDAMTLLRGNTSVNLDNEIEILKSFRLLNQVVDALNLDISYFEVGRVKTGETWDVPFLIDKKVGNDSLTVPLTYYVKIENSVLSLYNEEEEMLIENIGSSDINEQRNLPFTIIQKQNDSLEKLRETTYKFVIRPKKDVVLELGQNLHITPTDKKSEILSLSLISEAPLRSEETLNEVISKFDLDGILDRRLVSKRTLDFIDDRFIYLSQELDSIEEGKMDFKQENSLSYLESDVEITIQNKAQAENEVDQIETQIALAQILLDALSQNGLNNLLPANIGLENSNINIQVSDYNKLSLERQKMIVSTGEKHPTVTILTDQLERVKQNIVNTVNVYLRQLRISKNQLNQQRSRAGSVFAALPQKEKALRAIERQQSIKENLFLLLLEKREEAAISYAVTSPSIKVVDYALTKSKPISPRKTIVFSISLFLGLLMPIGILYMKMSLDTKIHSRKDIDILNNEIPILTEIPNIENPGLIKANDRSVLAESFRILSTNVNYLLPKENREEGRIIYVTSSVKGEGKTLVALNLAAAYVSLHKKVLLIGADLRNPQLHSYLGMDKSTTGLSDYLMDSKVPWTDCIRTLNDDPNFKICLSGNVPPNAPQLLSRKSFDEFLNNARKEFDYIIVDTAPTLLVTDTLLISQHADVTLFIVRADYTEKRLLEFSSDLKKSNKLKNMAYVINDVDQRKFSGYNYGYGYGYGEGVQPKKWYQKLFSFSKN